MKSYWFSKTLWLNVIALLALIIQGQWGFVISPEIQATLLILINIALRSISKEEIVWGKVKK